jgi:hypothetical protein
MKQASLYSSIDHGGGKGRDDPAGQHALTMRL